MLGANLSSAFTNTCSALPPVVHAIQYRFMRRKKKTPATQQICVWVVSLLQEEYLSAFMFSIFCTLAGGRNSPPQSLLSVYSLQTENQ